MKILFLALGLIALAGCEKSDDNSAAMPAASSSKAAPAVAPVAKAPVQRNYTAEQMIAGQAIFEKNCQVCHGQYARGESKDWQTARDDGTFPAPPLNGTAHAWHHSSKALLGTIDRGGVPLGGRMPPFKNVLTKEQKLAVLAYIQSRWPDEVYQAWAKNNS